MNIDIGRITVGHYGGNIGRYSKQTWETNGNTFFWKFCMEIHFMLFEKLN